jgi:membrane protease YdiL (CAAX protease family)
MSAMAGGGASVVKLDSPDRKLVAPVWHTVALVGLFIAITVAGALFQRGPQAHPGALQQHPQVAPLYLSLIVLEWGLVWFVCRGLRRTGTRLRELIGGRWSGPRDIVIDVLLGCGLWGLWSAVEAGWQRWLAAGHAASIQPLLPQRVLEMALWVVLSISAGICEEVVFRGYLQCQFKALTRSGLAGVALQAVLFGISHGYQGFEATLKITTYGALFGLLVMWRKSLRPGMIAHAWTDIFSGLIAG